MHFPFKGNQRYYQRLCGLQLTNSLKINPPPCATSPLTQLTLIATTLLFIISHSQDPAPAADPVPKLTTDERPEWPTE